MIDPELVRDVLATRHATKQFLPDRKISDDEFELILEAGQLSPSSFGFEPWDMIVVEEKSIRDEIVNVGSWGAKRPAEHASRFVILTALRSDELEASTSERITHVLRDIKGMDDDTRLGYLKKYKEWQFDDFHLDSPELLHQWAARQAYIALGNMMTIARTQDIDSCPIEGFSVDRVADVLERHGALDKEKSLPVVMVAFGYAAKAAPEKSRRPLEELVRVI